MTGKTRLIAEVENQEFGKNPTYFHLFSALSRLRWTAQKFIYKKSTSLCHTQAPFLNTAPTAPKRRLHSPVV